MEEIGVYEAKTHLPALLERVSKGEKITITKHGKPVALLVPPSTASEKRPVKEAIAEMQEFRKRRPKVSLKELQGMKEEGRR